MSCHPDVLLEINSWLRQHIITRLKNWNLRKSRTKAKLSIVIQVLSVLATRDPPCALWWWCLKTKTLPCCLWKCMTCVGSTLCLNTTSTAGAHWAQRAILQSCSVTSRMTGHVPPFQISPVSNNISFFIERKTPANIEAHSFKKM